MKHLRYVGRKLWREPRKRARERRRIREASLLTAQEAFERLLPYINFDGGFFVELGANDGLRTSNTYVLEKSKKWRGILIEPILDLYKLARKNRPHARLFNCACVGFDYQYDTVEMVYAGPMSYAKGAFKNEAGDEEFRQRAKEVQPSLTTYELVVPARTLTSILDECEVQRIDLLSLDVEGYEAEVLKGLDLEKYQPRYMLIEARFKDEIESIIIDKYKPVAELSYLDILYKFESVDLP